MADTLLRLYHALPAPLRSLAASARGAQLRYWRYGPETEGLVEEALARERWSAAQWAAWREDRLARLLHRAATRVPHYREYWEGRRRRGDRASWERLEEWPVLAKDALRANPLAFVADDCNVRRMFALNTSGTTGKPLRLWRSRATNRAWYALLDARLRRWHGVSWRHPWALLGGQEVVPATARRPPFWVWNGAMHQLYLSANHVSKANAAAYVAALAEHGITHLAAYPSSAAALARECLDAGTRAAGLKVVLTNAEPVPPWQRAVLHEAFGAPVRETYGMVEIVSAASECSAGSLHLWPEVGWLEVLDDEADRPAAPGSVGRFTCTGLLNSDMPLIRYAVGDRGTAPVPSVCACDRGLPVLRGIEGRTNDMLITADGRKVYWLNPVFYGLPVQEAQIVQDTVDALRIRYVPAAGFGADAGATMVTRLRSRMGDVRVDLERVGAIPRGPNGKFRAVVCNVRAADGAPAERASMPRYRCG
jgi:phenylacetate-CoA ligase